MKNFKNVILPINVPVSDYCWDGEFICEFFTTEEYDYGVCKLGFYVGEADKQGRKPKPDNCKELMEIK